MVVNINQISPIVHSCNKMPICKCSVSGCQSINKGDNVTLLFHCFPKDIKCRIQWLYFCRGEMWQPGSRSRVCSIHFDSSMYRMDPVSLKCIQKKNFLRPNAVPTLSQPENLQQKKDPNGIVTSTLKKQPKKILRALNVPYRSKYSKEVKSQIVHLKSIGQSYNEISRVLNVSVGTIRYTLKSQMKESNERNILNADFDKISPVLPKTELEFPEVIIRALDVPYRTKYSKETRSQIVYLKSMGKTDKDISKLLKIPEGGIRYNLKIHMKKINAEKSILNDNFDRPVVGTITCPNLISDVENNPGADNKQEAVIDLDATESDSNDSIDDRVEVLCPGPSKLGPTKLRILKVELERLTLPFKQYAHKETSTKLDKLLHGRKTKDKHCQTDNLLLDAVIMNFTQHLPYALRDHDFFSNMIYPDVDDLKRRAKTDIETVKRYISSLQRQLMTLHAELHTTRHDLEIAESEVTHLKTCLNKEV